MIGKRLKLARDSMGLSLRELSDALGNLVTFQAIQKYEKDEAMPGSAVLRALACSLGVTERYLLNPGKIEINDIRFRAGLVSSIKESNGAKARLLTAIEKYLDIESLVPGAESEWITPAGFPYPIVKIEDAELAAERLRSVWALGSQPVPHLADILEEKGIKVISAQLDPKIPAILCTFKRGNHAETPVIAINGDVFGERQNFGLAREFARLVLDCDAIAGETEAVCERFARALLILRDAVTSTIGKVRQRLTLDELVQLRELFGVSVVQIANRCVDLAIIGGNEKRRLFDIFASYGWSKYPYAEPGQRPARKGSRFTRLCLRAYTEDIISESRLAEFLGISTREVGKHLGLEMAF